ncbi:TniQ family protein [Chelativorans sp. AA-79]|uniref:TniQ family protein n=1 Tax=Chelativorans sp. AA-79 TaxID=3028735 RepID=UPI0023F8F6D1|nr:TniQ family protein [Chelativorans sp. AA-79]WEX11676.1 TniQ family protein [Chelativorans sp. AA-79]
MTQLTIRTRLHSGETPASFCSRLAAVNGRLKARHFCADMGFRFQDVVDGSDAALLRLAYLADVDVNSLRESAIRKTADGYEVDGQRVTRNLMIRNRLRFCPECLAEDMRRQDEHPLARAWGRRKWLISFIRTCDVHDVSLVECSVQQEPSMIHDFAAMVQADRQEIPEVAKRSVAREPSAFERYLHDRMTGRVGAFPFLDALPFYAAARFTELLGAVVTRGLKAPIRTFGGDDWWHAGAAGFAVTSSGEEGICSWLSEMQAAFKGKTGDAGGRALYGRLYEALAHDSDDSAYDPVRKLIRAHAIDTLPLGPGDELFGPITDRRWHSVQSASKEFGVHPKRLRKLLIETGVLAKENAALTDARIMLDAEEITEFVTEIKDTVSAKEAQKLVNAPRVHWGILVDRGYLAPHVKAGAKHGLQFRFRREDISVFLDRLLANTKLLTGQEPGLCSIPHAVRKANCKAVEILDLLLSGKLERAFRDPNEHGYMAVLVDPDELREKTMLEDHDGLSLREVEHKLGTKTQVVKALIEHGYLPARTAVNPINRCPQTIVMPEDLARFQRSYVSLMNLAKERGEHFSQVKSQLKSCGIAPAFDPTVVGATFYLRYPLEYSIKLGLESTS